MRLTNNTLFQGPPSSLYTMDITKYLRTMCRSPAVFWTLFLICPFLDGSWAEDCKIFRCGCKTSKVTIDLSILGIQPFVNQSADLPSDHAVYTFSICDLQRTCNDAVLCKKEAGTATILGKVSADPKQFNFTGDPSEGSLSIIYNNQPPGQSQSTTTSEVLLRCGANNFDAVGESPPGSNKYKFTFWNPMFCVSTGLSAGSILLIIFFVLVLVYIIGGVLYLRFAHGARGKEQIPNYDFWEDFPLLVRDGVVFVSKGCKPDPTYQAI